MVQDWGYNYLYLCNEEGIESIAILDSGAGISIATKSIWEK